MALEAVKGLFREDNGGTYEIDVDLKKIADRAVAFKDRLAGSFKLAFQARLHKRRAKKQEQEEAPGEQEAPEREYLDLPPTCHLQVGRNCWKDVPISLRGELWLSCSVSRSEEVLRYPELLQQELPKDVEFDIEKDTPRTYPSYRQFSTDEGKASLRNILRAYAAYDPEVGYTQGMNFLAGILLMFSPDEAHAFGALVVLMQDRELRRFYGRSMSMLQVQLWQLGKLMPGRLCKHMEACGVVPVLYGASWLMTCFSADFPVSFAARILDVLLADRCDAAMLKVAVSVLVRVEARLMAMVDLEDMLRFLKMDVPAWDEETLHEVLGDAFSRPWGSRQLGVLASSEGAETVAQAMERVAGMRGVGLTGALSSASAAGATSSSVTAAAGEGGAAAAGADGVSGGGATDTAPSRAASSRWGELTSPGSPSTSACPTPTVFPPCLGGGGPSLSVTIPVLPPPPSACSALASPSGALTPTMSVTATAITGG
eukprot:CAMPEP_0202859570 /NCGR_PEP_ID=MMETSP1391-20130828/1623_1 /ASSEMBLY_ACC=CAM_ASM_000867 /TAXON_ID=1034604 /ORGANISM="Chlamydomonas leiostraca, Strain SAG 11-49" /LENGTH=484 /DNA_ID=CAMNT_0049538615 /DNA_START=127 /DNA_END=1577 /DNA_ORIENTATION=+